MNLKLFKRKKLEFDDSTKARLEEAEKLNILEKEKKLQHKLFMRKWDSNNSIPVLKSIEVGDVIKNIKSGEYCIATKEADDNYYYPDNWQPQQVLLLEYKPIEYDVYGNQEVVIDELVFNVKDNILGRVSHIGSAYSFKGTLQFPKDDDLHNNRHCTFNCHKVIASSTPILGIPTFQPEFLAGWVKNPVNEVMVLMCTTEAGELKVMTVYNETTGMNEVICYIPEPKEERSCTSCNHCNPELMSNKDTEPTACNKCDDTYCMWQPIEQKPYIDKIIENKSCNECENFYRCDEDKSLREECGATNWINFKPLSDIDKTIQETAEDLIHFNIIMKADCPVTVDTANAHSFLVRFLIEFIKSEAAKNYHQQGLLIKINHLIEDLKQAVETVKENYLQDTYSRKDMYKAFRVFAFPLRKTMNITDEVAETICRKDFNEWMNNNFK